MTDSQVIEIRATSSLLKNLPVQVLCDPAAPHQTMADDDVRNCVRLG